MTNDMMELNLNEMEMVNGGWNWTASIVGGIFGGIGAAGYSFTFSGSFLSC